MLNGNEPTVSSHEVMKDCNLPEGLFETLFAKETPAKLFHSSLLFAWELLYILTVIMYSLPFLT